MNLFLYQLEGFVYLGSFLLCLITLLFLFEIIRRTNQLLRKGYLFLFFSTTGFGVLMALSVASFFQIATIQLLPGIISIISIFFFLLGVYYVRAIIKDIADFGQTLVVSDKENYSKEILPLFKQSDKICYVYFNQDSHPSSKVTNALETKASMVITSREDIHTNHLIHVPNDNLKDLTEVLERILKEQRFDTVIFDSLTEVKGIQPYEIPLVVQQLSETMKKHNVAGYFIADQNKLSYSVIDDISMIIDRVKR